MKGPLVRLSMAKIVLGFGPHGHNLQDYINTLTDSVGEPVARYVLREEDGELCVYYVTVAEDQDRGDRWQRLISCMEEADVLQQQLLGAEHEAACYEFHSQLSNMAEEFRNWAEEEGYAVDD